MSNKRPQTKTQSFAQWLMSTDLAVYRKAFCAMTLAAGMALPGSGCASQTASMLAMASRPSSDPITTDRLMSVARVFETQQNYGKASQIYKLVVSQQPNNYEAQQQIAWIDSLGSGIPVPNPRLQQGQQVPQAMYANSSAPVPAPPAAAPPARFNPQTPQEALSASPGPKIPVVISGTDPVTGEQYMLDSDGSLPVEAPLPAASVVDTYEPAPAVIDQTPVEYPVESFEIDAFAAPVGSVSLSNDDTDNGPWALPVSGTEQPYLPPVSDVSYEQQPIEQLSGEFAEPAMAGGTGGELGPIEQFVEKPEQSIPQLVEFLTSPDSDVRSLAAFLIGETAWRGASALPALNQRLAEEPHEVIQITIAEAVAKIDSQSRSAYEVMAGCLQSPEKEVRSQAAFAMRVYAAAGHPECVERLAECLTDEDENVRSMAALSLGDFGPTAAAATASLEAALNDQSANVRDAASAALSRIATK